MSRLCRAVMVVAAILFAFAGSASADDVSEASDHYKKGTKAFELGAFDEAVAEYAAAYRLRDDPALLYNLGQADHATASDAATTTAQLQGVDVATIAPADQQLLQYSSTNSRWQPFTPNFVAASPQTKVAYGVIAEKTPSPLLTQENDAFSMSNAVGVLMASVKAQQAHIAELEARLAKLEGRKQHASRTKAAAPAIPRAPAE